MIRGSISVPVAIQNVERLVEHDGQKGNGLRQEGILSSREREFPV